MRCHRQTKGDSAHQCLSVHRMVLSMPPITAKGNAKNPLYLSFWISKSVNPSSNRDNRCSSPPLLLYGWSEDCLNLNIFRPQMQNRTNKLPVAVYFHGGAFNAGSGTSIRLPVQFLTGNESLS